MAMRVLQVGAEAARGWSPFWDGWFLPWTEGHEAHPIGAASTPRDDGRGHFLTRSCPLTLARRTVVTLHGRF